MTAKGIVQTTGSKRVKFGKIRLSSEYPDLLEIQIKSFQEFFQLETTPENRINEGLYKVFQENFPITDARNIFVLEFLDYFVDPPRYSIEECMQRGLTYSVPLKAKLRLSCNDEEHIDFQTIVQDVFLGNIPYMTPKGTFSSMAPNGLSFPNCIAHRGFSSGKPSTPTVRQSILPGSFPFKGAWMEFATDINTVMYAYIDRKKKFPVTTLLRAIGYDTDKAILDIFGLADEIPVNPRGTGKSIGRKLRQGYLRTWTEDFVDEDTGEVVTIERNEIILERDVLEEDNIDLILQSDAQMVILQKEDIDQDFSIIYNTLQKDPSSSELEAVNISTANCAVQIHPMKKQLAVSSKNCSSRTNAIIWGSRSL
jgi:DNA-directed RNA polymerase subunit beta